MVAVTGLPVDSSRPYQYPSELTALVEAVTRADPNNESTWIEWKSWLDLADKSGHFHLAKHVLGFANRTVATARTHAGGHAYVVVGAEPGNTRGITTVDQAVLVPQIVRYVGPAVRWHPEYVSVGGHQVLVVVVDPPQHGDPIHPVRAQLDRHDKGTILVRRPGATDRANDHEIDQLVARVRSGQGGLTISIEPISGVIEHWPSFPDFEELAAAEQAAALARPRVGTARPGDSWTLAAQSFAIPSLLEQPDSRSEEDYRSEVDDYAQAYGRALQERCSWRLWRHRPACLQLEAVNLSEENFSDIELDIHVPGDVRSWPDELKDMTWGDEPSLPGRPVVLGTPQRKGFGIDYASILNPVAANSYTPSISRGPSLTIRDTGSVTISYSGIDLRPEQRRELQRAPLIVNVPEGTTLDCEWSATARNVPRRLSGRFCLTVGPSTISFAHLEVDLNIPADSDDD